jgi:HEAT repeat protein
MMRLTTLTTKLFGDEVPLKRLLNDLTNPDGLIRWSAAFELEDLKDKRAVTPLIRSLKDNDPDVRREAATTPSTCCGWSL